MFRSYAKEHSFESYWIGVHKIDGHWVKTNGRKIEPTELTFNQSSVDGDCIIGDSEHEYEPKVVDCNKSFMVIFNILTENIYF